jgi:hypothetical protein
LVEGRPALIGYRVLGTMKLIEQNKVDAHGLGRWPRLSQGSPRHASAIAVESVVEDKDADVRTQRHLGEPIVKKNEIGLGVRL